MALMKNIVPIILTGAFGLTLLAQGIPTPIGFVTISTLALLIGVGYIVKHRQSMGLPIIPVVVLKMPIVIASLVYFSLGVLSITLADNKFMCVKEMIQRVLIILLPMFVFCLVPRKPEDLKKVILQYLPVCGFIALVAAYDAHHSGFSKPAYTFGMHKNHIAGSCSIMATIAIAALLTSGNLKRRMYMFVCLGVGLLGCVASQGKAGLCCIIVATTFMLIAHGAKPRNILYFVGSVLLIGGVLWNFLPKEAIEHVVSTKKFSTNEIRMSLWTDVLPVLIKEPFTAVGWGNMLVKNDRFFGDCACVLLYDWFQLTIVGALALVTIIILAIKLPLDNARRIPKNSPMAFVNLVALGIICGRFTHSMVDTFWIGRGVTLTAWAAIGMAIFIKLYLDQLQSRARGSGVASDSRLTYAKQSSAR
ncbi:hypothetical protein BH10CYA1_BH10CYA1_55100 [soil metagenome]